LKVRLRLFANLAEYLPPDADGDGVTLEFPDGALVSDVLAYLRIPERVPFLSVVNGHEVEDPHPLHDGDELTIFPPLSGGSAR
jgi:molybdopterin converting factor small subunit